MTGELHQFLTGAAAGDAITGQALIIRSWLRERGFKSQIFAQHIHKSMESEIRHLSVFRNSQKQNVAIYHHSIGSDLPDFLINQSFKLILIYHNITPVEFFERSDPGRAELSRLGLEQLDDIRPITVLAVADSTYNAQDLYHSGYKDPKVLPITLHPEDYNVPDVGPLADQLRGNKPYLLFVGRIAPNKKQEDLVKLLFYCRRLNPDLRLILVGDRWEVGYDNWVEEMATEIGVADGLVLTGKVSQQEMVTYYRHADFYVSMSEHEGFGVPLIESMYLGVPVIAFASSAVPGTMGQAGLLFYEKDFEKLAELISILLDDQDLRGRMVEKQRRQVQKYLEPEVRKEFYHYLNLIGIFEAEPGEVKK